MDDVSRKELTELHDRLREITADLRDTKARLEGVRDALQAQVDQMPEVLSSPFRRYEDNIRAINKVTEKLSGAVSMIDDVDLMALS